MAIEVRRSLAGYPTRQRQVNGLSTEIAILTLGRLALMYARPNMVKMHEVTRPYRDFNDYLGVQCQGLWTVVCQHLDNFVEGCEVVLGFSA